MKITPVNNVIHFSISDAVTDTGYKPDPIEVIIRTDKPHKGGCKLTIEGEIYSGYWGNMPSERTEDFIKTAPTDYLLDSFVPLLHSQIIDFDAYRKVILDYVNEEADETDATEEEIEEYRDVINQIKDSESRKVYLCHPMTSLFYENVYHDETIPYKPNPVYDRYLSIIALIQKAVREYCQPVV